MIEASVRLRRLFTSASGGAWGVEPDEGEVVAYCIRGTDFDYEILRADARRAPERGFSRREYDLRSLKPGDLIIEKSGGGEQQPVGRAVLFDSDLPAVPTNFAGRLRASDDTDPRFACYVLASLYSDGRTRACIKQTTGIQNLDLGAFLTTPVTKPSRGEQRAIANYLDTETARIDALITKKRRMIELLDERLGVYMRCTLESAGEWMPLKRRWTVTDCKHRTPTYIPSGYPVASPGDINPGRIDLSGAHRFVARADYEDLADHIRRPRRGDIIYSRNASIGIAAYVDTDEEFCMGQDVCRISSPDQSQIYLTYVLNTLGVDQLEVQKIGSTFSRVNVAQILELLIPSPPPDVQDAIAEQLDLVQEQRDHAVGLLGRQIELLREHRQALITAAVTGELEIPGVAA